MREFKVIAYWNDKEPWYLNTTKKTVAYLEKMGARVEKL